MLNKGQRLQAVSELARAGKRRAISVLVEALARDPDVAVRRAAATALSGGSDGDDAAPALTAALGDAESAIRIQALNGLRAILGEQSADFLMEAVAADEDPIVRRTAVQLAATLGGEHARAVAELASSDTHVAVRRAVKAALASAKP